MNKVAGRLLGNPMVLVLINLTIIFGGYIFLFKLTDRPLLSESKIAREKPQNVAVMGLELGYADRMGVNSAMTARYPEGYALSGNWKNGVLHLDSVLIMMEF